MISFLLQKAQFDHKLHLKEGKTNFTEKKVNIFYLDKSF